jgi:hypothetical protein
VGFVVWVNTYKVSASGLASVSGCGEASSDFWPDSAETQNVAET